MQSEGGQRAVEVFRCFRYCAAALLLERLRSCTALVELARTLTHSPRSAINSSVPTAAASVGCD